MIDENHPGIGRFDKSFLIHMIKDFFLVLLLVTVLEFALKAGMVYYNFRVNGAAEARVVAEDLADNVRSIMRNEGGPVAARTMYPILDRNWTDLGYVVEIAPSPVTVRSIEAGFGFRPEGITRADWPEGRFQSAAIEIEAETFCLACHAEAEVGQTLGVVTVRNYLARDFALWFEDVQLSAGLAVGKIVLHSVLLFLILRARMEPLLRLRAVVGKLARAYGSLDHRAEIRTSDEFGSLARDLNLFLDRISKLVDELDGVLNRVVDINDAIVSVQGGLRDRIDGLVGGIRKLEREAMMSAKRAPRLSNAWFDAARGAVAQLDTRLRSAGAGETEAVLDNLRAVVTDAEAQIASSEMVFARLADLGDESEKLHGALTEMTRLEERMRGNVETGGTLVRRLRPGTGRTGDDPAPPLTA